MYSWAGFFRKLGVVDFLAFKEELIQIKREELVCNSVVSKNKLFSFK
jgi:hypothetical protein